VPSQMRKPIQPNDFTRKMAGKLNNIFSYLELMQSAQQSDRLPQGSNGSASSDVANPLLKVPAFSNGSASNDVVNPLSKVPAFSSDSASNDAVKPLLKP
jgi:hypothetical protein